MSKPTLVDLLWVCGCGSMNAAYRETCGGCNKPKEKL
jgi:hypothetical protein|tara:strand:- start:1064 stop:1174 length:111 start_codon:yes stop_codon:yes gene_type:complete